MILFFKELTFIIADWMAAKQKICIVLKWFKMIWSDLKHGHAKNKK